MRHITIIKEDKFMTNNEHTVRSVWKNNIVHVLIDPISKKRINTSQSTIFRLPFPWLNCRNIRRWKGTYNFYFKTHLSDLSFVLGTMYSIKFLYSRTVNHERGFNGSWDLLHCLSLKTMTKDVEINLPDLQKFYSN